MKFDWFDQSVICFLLLTNSLELEKVRCTCSFTQPNISQLKKVWPN